MNNSGAGNGRSSPARFLYRTAYQEAERLHEVMTVRGLVERACVVGALRRELEVVDSIEFLVSGADRHKVHAAFDGQHSLNIPVHVTTTSSSHFPHALLLHTGSVRHLEQLSLLAQRHGFELNGTGLSRFGQPIHCDEEAGLYHALGLPFIPPELREGLGEIEAAAEGRLERLICAQDIRGILHNHSTYSDGTASVEDMVRHAQVLGYQYIGISDHSQSAPYVEGLPPEQIEQQHREIDIIQCRTPDIRIFKGIESEILKDGSLDYDDQTLASFDFVIGSVHSYFDRSRSEQTTRVLRALEHPALTMLGHPTGRLFFASDGYDIDLHQVIDAADAHGKIIELNANPHRLDLDWRMCRYAQERGVRVCINPDAHNIEGLRNVPLGVQMARKGGLEKVDVINTLPVADMETYLQRGSHAGVIKET